MMSILEKTVFQNRRAFRAEESPRVQQWRNSVESELEVFLPRSVAQLVADKAISSPISQQDGKEASVLGPLRHDQYCDEKLVLGEDDAIERIWDLVKCADQARSQSDKTTRDYNLCDAVGQVSDRRSQ